MERSSPDPQKSPATNNKDAVSDGSRGAVRPAYPAESWPPKLTPELSSRAVTTAADKAGPRAAGASAAGGIVRIASGCGAAAGGGGGSRGGGGAGGGGGGRAGS